MRWLALRRRGVKDPSAIGRVRLGDRQSDDAGNVVRVLLIGDGDDGRNAAGAGVQSYAGLALVVDGSGPGVDGADGRVVPAGREPSFEQAAGEVEQPGLVGRGDDDFAHLFGTCGHWSSALRWARSC